MSRRRASSGRARCRRGRRRDQLRRPGQERAELAQAVAAGILVNVESTREIRLLSQPSRAGWRVPARVAVRVNPDFELKSSGMKMGGGPKQFGIDAEQVPDALAEIGALGLAFEGFHIFGGSQNLRADAICEAQRKTLELALRLARRCAGAGARRSTSAAASAFPYFPGEQPLDLAPIGAQPARMLERPTRDELPRGIARHRARPLPRRRGRHLRVPRRRSQGFARPGVPGHRRRPAPSSGRLRQLRPGDPQELSGRDRQPRARRAAASRHRSSARCARRSICSPTAWISAVAQPGRPGRRVPVGCLRTHGEPASASSAIRRPSKFWSEPEARFHCIAGCRTVAAARLAGACRREPCPYNRDTSIVRFGALRWIQASRC